MMFTYLYFDILWCKSLHFTEEAVSEILKQGNIVRADLFCMPYSSSDKT